MIRDGVELRIASRDVVSDDLLVLHEGDRIATDAVLLQGQVFLALQAWRLSRQQVLTRRVAAVEALGAITVLAVDKAALQSRRST